MKCKCKAKKCCKEKMSDEKIKLCNLIAGFSLIAQFIAVLITALTVEKKSKGTKIVILISAIGAAFGSVLLSKELVAPAVSKKMSEYKLDPGDTDFNFDDEIDEYENAVNRSWYDEDEIEEEEISE